MGPLAAAPLRRPNGCIQSATVKSDDCPTRPARLHLSLFGDCQRVVNLDPEVSHGVFKFRMAEQELNGSEIPGAAIDQRRLGSPQRMSAVSRWIKPNRSRPGPDDPGILPSRKVRRRRHTARKEGPLMIVDAPINAWVHPTAPDPLQSFAPRRCRRSRISPIRTRRSAVAVKNSHSTR